MSTQTNNSPAQTAPQANKQNTAQAVHQTSQASAKPVAQEDQNTSKPVPMKKVEIVISGNTYNVNCPANEEDELKSAVFYINNFIHNIRQDAPHLSHENLLVLCCLNLYEKIHDYEQENKNQHLETQRSRVLIDKILKDAKSMLP